MIREITIGNVATYTSPMSIAPKQVNFIYGGNGSGKTTLSRIISGSAEGDYEVLWNGEPLTTLVFNREFVQKNFSEKIGGIFTLGEDDAEALNRLEALKGELEEIGRDIERKRGSIREKEEQRDSKFQDFSEACWVQRTTLSGFAEVLKGTLGGKRMFAKACLKKAKSIEPSGDNTIDALLIEYGRVFGSTPEKHNLVDIRSICSLVEPECPDFMETPIVGTADTPIGAFIDFLQNSNWVRQGIAYHGVSDGKCPYCQRPMPESLQDEIEAYFDDRYKGQLGRLDEFRRAYGSFAEALSRAVEGARAAVPRGYETDAVDAAIAVLKGETESNIRAIDRKVGDPSSKESVLCLRGSLDEVVRQLEEINGKIRADNLAADNISAARNDLSNKVWALILHNLRGPLNKYQKEERGCEKAISNIRKLIVSLEEKRAKCNEEAVEIERARTSIAPTVGAINDLLNRFGFRGFSLAEDGNGSGMYKIVRPDGADAKETLSEGEHNFISFLYFFHLVYGSLSREGIDEPRVVVIDDPISSLDSNVMFIVTTLVREIAKNCKDNLHGIKQVFILTHNVYFHKEVTFLGSRREWPKSMCAYWVINKVDEVSSVTVTDSNPIGTSYELLWDELRNLDGVPNKNIFNTMRRILEYYFNVIGGIDLEKCIQSFEGADRVACRALISCINEGSHMITDDFVMCFSAESLETYRRVFRQIFYNMGHSSHYEMMMRENASLPAQA